MQKLFIVLFISIVALNASGQSADGSTHVDSTNSYKIPVPNWWQIKETAPQFFGGTFPTIDKIENALIIKCFAKAKYKDLNDFENWVIKDYSMGQSPKWSSQHTMLLKKVIPDFKEIGNAWKTQLMKGAVIYDCCYILTETSTAYIWIDFTATTATYPVNFDKLKEIMSGFKKF